MNSVATARRLAQEMLELAAVAEEAGELSDVQLLAKHNANLQLRICDLFDCVAVLNDRIDTLEGQLNNYRMGEL